MQKYEKLRNRARIERKEIEERWRKLTGADPIADTG